MTPYVGSAVCACVVRYRVALERIQEELTNREDLG